jgi:acyl-CoA thioester hydrolase
MIMHTVDIYVRYCETDAGGHVSNTSYFLYFEEARTKFFGEIGYGPNKRSIHFIVAQTECDFRAQAYAAQILTVTTKVSAIGTKSYTIAHEITDAKTGELIATGSAVIVCYNFETEQSEAIPDNLRAILEEQLEPAEL